MNKVESIRRVKGMNDTWPGSPQGFLDTAVWEEIFNTAKTTLGGYGFRRVWLPVVEHTALFGRGIGATTDIVSKEMYTFERHKTHLTLRPEGTAGAVRAYVDHKVANTSPQQRWWYAGPMFRAERPQEGRYRQFYQIGAELFGPASPFADAEMIAMLWQWITALQLEGITVRINTLGGQESRKAYKEALLLFLRGRNDELCESCQGRLGSNPLRVLDCKRPPCRAVVAEAPHIADSLTAASAQHMQMVCALLDAQHIPYTCDQRLVRGLDYYTGTLFEFTTEDLGAQNAIIGGGRYDDLVAELGGPATPAIGFAAGIERLALLLSSQARFTKRRHGADLFIVPMQGEGASVATQVRAFELATAIRALGPWRVEVEVSGGRLKHQMRRADKSGAQTALVLGEQELTEGRGQLKHLATARTSQVCLTPEAIIEALLIKE